MPLSSSEALWDSATQEYFFYACLWILMGNFPGEIFTAERILSLLILRVDKGMEESPQESSEEIFLDPHYHYD